MQTTPTGTGKAGLMDLLAGGHVDDATFAQAIQLLKLEDWESLRLLLAGAPEACNCAVAYTLSVQCSTLHAILIMQALHACAGVPGSTELTPKRNKTPVQQEAPLQELCGQQVHPHRLQQCISSFQTFPPVETSCNLHRK